MTLAGQVQLGIDFLLSNRNSDGGIPSTAPHQPSGSWTTASTLEALIRCPHLSHEKYEHLRGMTAYLLAVRIAGGGWPMARGASNASTMATGHAVAALAAAKCLYSAGTATLADIDTAIAEAQSWMEANQNPDGGWAIEPTGGGATESRLISTCYALRGFFALGHRAASYSRVKNATGYVGTLFNGDGGCGAARGADSDVCSTARALQVLLQSGAHGAKDELIAKALAYLLKHQHVWDITTEKYVAPGAPGMISYHGNTPYDLLLAFLEAGQRGKKVDALIELYSSSQDPANGCWYLADAKKKEKIISTWPTAEAIEVLDRFIEVKADDAAAGVLRKRFLQVAVILLIAIASLQGVLLAGAPAAVSDWWSTRPDWLKDFIVLGLVAGVIAAVIGAFLADGIKGVWKRLWNPAKS